MACFLVTVAEAVVTTVATKIVEKRELKRIALSGGEAGEISVPKIRFSEKLKWLNRLLWGGSALLAFEHIWHGEVTPFFPFLTAASDPADRAGMFREMGTVGVAMALAVTAVWLGMIGVSALIRRRAKKELPAEG